MLPESGDGVVPNARPAFCTTRWSVVLLAAERTTPESVQALESLCQLYWYPLYAFVRREGRGPEEAKDSIQEFFARFLAADSIQTAHPDKGRFRSFLLASMKNFLAKEWRDANRLKRGGGKEIIHWDQMEVEERYKLEPADAAPDALFDRRWAQTLVTNVLARLQEEMGRERLGERFAALKIFLQGDSTASSYADTGTKLGLSESAVKSAIHRLRRRYAELIREEISQTVAAPAEVAEEIRHLIRMLAA
ncbi:MAG: sigma-70 family RNA polymerase sigma factor [Verrucomicrobiales bacterium]|nr:sigma-70 family RNA polymerase sigma factor [Verrucomicrobiales bacterium]